MKNLFLILLMLASCQLYANAPVIAQVPDQRASQGNTYSYQLSLEQAQQVNWIKTFGPDDVTVNSVTGVLTWNIPSDLPSESFHLGVKAINEDGVDEQTWILTVGDGSVLYIGPDEEIQTLKDGMAALESGDTLVMRNGVWLNSGGDNIIPGGSGNKYQTLPGGNEAQYTTLIGEDPGQVIIDAENQTRTINIFGSTPHPDFPPSGSSFAESTDYIAIKGLVLTNSTYESLRVEYSTHVKLINLGIGPSAKEDDGIGHYANVYIYRSRYVLIEGMYAWGHGRYKIQFKDSSEGVVRRSVVRIDDYDGELPLGGYISYCSRNILFQNNIMVDSDQSNYWLDHYELTNAFGVAATNCYDYPLGNVFKAGLSLNTHMGLMKADVRNTLEKVVWENIVGWDMKPDKQAGGTGGGVPILSGVAVTESKRITLGNVLLNGDDVSDFYFYSRDGGQLLTSTVQDSILFNLGWNGESVEDRGELIRNTGSTDFELLNNNIFGFIGGLTQAGSVNEVDTLNINPEYKYITMLPRVSVLRTSSTNGGIMGAELLTMTGRSGTHYGDAGYNDETQIPMWPVAVEGLAHQHMSAFILNGTDRNGNSDGITGARGFAVQDQTLTNYVWGYLGNTVPPFNTQAVAGNQRAIITWQPSAALAQNNLQAYKIYQKQADTLTLLGETNSNEYRYIATGLSNNQTYEFVVTAIDNTANESDYAYVVSATPAEGIKPKAPVLSFVE